MLAALLGRGQATFASKLVIADGKATVTREVDGGLQTARAACCPPSSPPTSASTRRASPSLPNIIKARAKPLTKTTAAELGVDLAPRLKTLKVEAPPPRKAGVIVASVDELVAKLRAAEVLP